MSLDDDMFGASPTPPTGADLKREGMARAASGASDEWKADMLECVRQIALAMDRFTADDVFDLADAKKVPPHSENRAFGPIMMRAAKLQYCQKLLEFPDSQLSRRPQLHATPIQIWESLIYANDL